jgi:hypothetical protein
MTRDLTPSRADLWRLVQNYGSISHAARAIGITRDEMEVWLSGKKEIPMEYYDALLALIGNNLKGQK